MPETIEGNFDLLHILRLIKKNFKFILFFTIGALIITFILLLIVPPKYQATTTFIVRHPLLLDRGHAFRQDFYQNKNYFAEEEIIDEVVAIAKSPKVIHNIIDSFKLVDIYGDKAYNAVAKRMKVKRNDTREVDIKFNSIDSNRSVDITNFTRNFIEKEFAKYFTEWNASMMKNIQYKIDALDQNLLSLNDSIVKLKSGDFERLTIDSGISISNQSAVKQEILADLIKVKDKLSSDRANYKSLLFEYSLGLDNDDLKMFYVIRDARIDDLEYIPNKFISMAAVCLAALIFSCLLVIARAGYKRI